MNDTTGKYPVLPDPNQAKRELTEAERLITTLAGMSDKIDHMVVAFSTQGKPGVVVAGLTQHTPMMWVLGALDYLRWHCFNAMTAVKISKDIEDEAALEIAAKLKKEGLIN